MDKDEARSIARERVTELRTLSWAQLRDRYLDDAEHAFETARSGVTYHVETEAVWDGGREGDLRVLVAVDDGGRKAFAPLVEDFIVAPDGSFVGE